MTPELRAWHLEFGRQSGFPPCCIAFYLDVWLPFWDSPSAPDRPLPLDDVPAVDGTDHMPDWRYRPCPGCRATGARVLVQPGRPPYLCPDPEIAEMWPD